MTDDGGPGEPTLAPPMPLDFDDLDTVAESGRGLPIINALSACWGWQGDVSGRTVTAIFLTP